MKKKNRKRKKKIKKNQTKTNSKQRSNNDNNKAKQKDIAFQKLNLAVNIEKWGNMEYPYSMYINRAGARLS